MMTFPILSRMLFYHFCFIKKSQNGWFIVIYYVMAVGYCWVWLLLLYSSIWYEGGPAGFFNEKSFWGKQLMEQGGRP